MATPPLHPSPSAHAEPHRGQTCAANPATPATRAATSKPARRWWPALPTTERARVRWFVAGHVLAVWAVLQLAYAFGEGHAPPPFPPSLTPEQRAAALTLPGQAGDTPMLPGAGATASSAQPAAAAPVEGAWRTEVDPGRPLEATR